MTAESAAVDPLRRAFESGLTRPYRWRRSQLLELRRMLLDNRQAFEDALTQDLGKHPVESDITEIGVLVGEIDHALRRLKRWMRPSPVHIPLALAPGSARIVHEPLGVVLIIGPWNYPLQLILAPLIGALAAGNTAIIKPSEIAAATSATLADLVPRYLDRRAIRVVEGDADITGKLLEQRLDHVFFTGSEQVGRVVAAAAAKTLTPMTLELGGKSPVYIDGTVDAAVAARRIMWGKLLNAGQTCVAPDYVLATPATARALVPHLQRAVRQMYGTDPESSEDYGSIITEKHTRRLAALLEGQPVSFGGAVSVPKRFVAPTVIDGASPSSAIMHEEIFGPVLPIVHVHSAEEARAFIRARPKPLATYVFSRDRGVRKAFVAETSSGALSFGAPAVHLGAPKLPFGGVGASGVGSYHGKHSFTTFSHAKAVLDKPLHPDSMRLAYPPYGGRLKGLLLWLLTGVRGAPRSR